jgi:DNA polymerase-3 subunit gamma/tau
MEHFVVSARKYRPEKFEDVVGQQAITNTLDKAIEQNHLAQALLFTGPRGVGKTSCARILAKKINQDENTDTSTDFSFNIFELDAASNNSVEDIRSLTDQVRIPPQTGKYKVYIIDEVHMLSQSAFNAFLKTLEEPPKHAIFILATTEKHKIIPTILSRCQIFDFKRITVTDIKLHLQQIAKKEGVNAEDDALHIIAQKADGAMRDALSTYDRVVSFSGINLTRKAVTENLNVLDYDTFFTATDLILENKIPDLLVFFNTILSKGFDGQHFIGGLANHFRDLLVCKNSATIPLLEVGENTKENYKIQSEKTAYPFLMKAIDLANTCDFEYKTSINQRLHVELCLMKLASITKGGQAEKKKLDASILSPEEVLAPSQFKAENTEKTTQQVNENKVSKQQPKLQETEQVKAKADLVQGSNSDKKTYSTSNTESNKVEEETNQKENNNTSQPSSGFSLGAIKKKKQLIEEQKNNQEEAIVLNEKFTEDDFLKAWNSYIDLLEKKGNKILTSTLNTGNPKLNGLTIHLTYPNNTMKESVLKAQNKLLVFLKDKLKNTGLKLQIDVDFKEEKKFAYTPREKYMKMLEANPELEKLRKTFELDI